MKKLLSIIMFQSNYYTAGKEAVRDLRKYNSLGQGHKLQCGIFSWSFIFWLFIYFFSPRRKPFQHPRVTFTRVFLTRRKRTHRMSADWNLTNFFSQKKKEKIQSEISVAIYRDPRFSSSHRYSGGIINIELFITCMSSTAKAHSSGSFSPFNSAATQ